MIVLLEYYTCWHKNDVHENAQATDVVKRIIDIGVISKSFGVNDISISSVLPQYMILAIHQYHHAK